MPFFLPHWHSSSVRQKKLHATTSLGRMCHFLAPVGCCVSLTEMRRFSMLMRNHKVLFLKTMRLCKGCRRTIPCPDLLHSASSDPFPRKTMMRQVQISSKDTQNITECLLISCSFPFALICTALSRINNPDVLQKAGYRFGSVVVTVSRKTSLIIPSDEMPFT